MPTNLQEKILHKDLSYKIQGLVFAVRNDLGSGHKEAIYQKALERELTHLGLAFQREPAIKIYSRRGEFLGLYRPDFLIENKIIVELKSAGWVTRQENARTYDYLRNSEYELAYLVNFSSKELYCRRFIFTNDRKKWLKLALLVAISLLFVAIGGLKAEAASLYFEPAKADLVVSETKTLTLYLDSIEGINAIEGKIIYPARYLDLRGVSDGNSIISLWIQKPAVPEIGRAQPAPDLTELDFAGVIPGGFASNHGKILSLQFSAKKSGQASVALGNVQAFISDGKATPAKLNLKSAAIGIKEAGPSKQVPPEAAVEDKIPPEPFTPEVSKDPNLFNGWYFLVFSAQDKGSGVDHYEVSEEQGFFRPVFGPAYENFRRANSPYFLQDQDLQSWIFVRALDKNGNERLAMVAPRHPPFYQKLLTILALAVVIVLVVLVYGRLRRRTRG